jgi:hypothetical protein
MDVLAGLEVDLATQRDFVASRAPALAEVLDALVALLRGPVRDRLAEAWAGRAFGAFYERPLLLVGALRDDALREGPSHPLWATLAADAPRPAVRDEVSAALDLGRASLWERLAVRHVQTNETSRAVAWLWPASLAPDRPVALYDVGCSAGLNLVADRLPWIWSLPEPATRPRVASRTGFDPRPLDVREAADARWLRACVWPGQPEREARLDQAIAAFRRDPPRLDVAGAGDIPARLPTCGATGPRGLAYQTIMRDYVPPDERARYEAGMRDWLERSAPGSALWVELEVTPDARAGGPPAAITAHVRADRPRSFVLAHCDPHPRALTVHADEVAALATALA